MKDTEKRTAQSALSALPQALTSPGSQLNLPPSPTRPFVPLGAPAESRAVGPGPENCRKRRFVDCDELPFGYVIMDPNTRILEINRMGRDMLGRSRENLIGREVAESVSDDSLPSLHAHLKYILEEKEVATCELEMVTRLGSPRMRLLSRPRLNPSGAVEEIHSAIVDVTSSKEEVHERTSRLEKANAELREEIARWEDFERSLRFSTTQIIEYSKRRKLLSRRLVELLEQDRRDMAMALHDHIGQILTTLKMDLEILRKKTPEEGVKTVLDSAVEKASQAMSFSRNFSQELRPAMLDTLGLVHSIQNLIAQMSKSSGLEISFFHKGITRNLGSEKELTLYRILQEALTNVLKHASARSVDVTLIRKNGSVLLTVEDDGAGFDHRQLSSAENGPLGIMIMKERAVQSGGTLDIESKPGKGTHLSVRIPVQGEA